MKEKITAIIPTYNSEEFIDVCINSILMQTYQNFEIIIVNDGSTDGTLKKLKVLQKKDKRIKVIDIENHRQGYCRNLALKEATGDFIMFIDSDDFIKPVTFEVALKRIIKDDSDFVVFDYQYFLNGERYVYNSKERFHGRSIIEGKECEMLLTIKAYFTVNRIYRKEFLISNNIKYGEGYFYEDVIFWLRACVKAKKVSVIHSPLYVIVNYSQSTTRTNRETDVHYRSLIEVFKESIPTLKNDCTDRAAALYIYYLIKKYLSYYHKRTPFKYRLSFMREFYNLLKQFKINYKYFASTYLRICGKFGFYRNICLFFCFTYLQLLKSFTIRVLRKIKKRLTSYKRRIKKESLNITIFKKLKDRELKKQILFMGFDYRYTGNSRYLFEEIEKTNVKLLFATTNELVPAQNRVIPKSKEFFEALYSSKIVIFESWITKGFLKPEGAVWINLWHGTPLKKMLYDSDEKDILEGNPNHKIEKYNAIQKMDYLLTDHVNANKLFETSFLMDSEKLLPYGYPRVKYLIENKDNKKLKKQLRTQLGIDEKKKIVLYLPTWRDYNYGQEVSLHDYSYLLDKEKLAKMLGDNYILLCKDHMFLNTNQVKNTDMETQELLLIGDYLITDFSSVMFDAFPIDLPVCLFVKDYEKYSKSRGVYEDLWEMLVPFVVDNEEALVKQIKNYKINKDYQKFKKEYGYLSEGDLTPFIIEKLEKDYEKR